MVAVVGLHCFFLWYASVVMCRRCCLLLLYLMGVFFCAVGACLFFCLERVDIGSLFVD